jgi:hypothetical protein
VKPLRQISAAAMLSLILAVGVLAGQIESNGATATPPPPQTTSTVTAIVLAVLSVVYP